MIYIKLTSIDAKLSASKKKSHNLEHQQENKHEQSEYLFSPDVTTTKSRSAKHGNGKAVGFWSDKRVGNSNRDCSFLKQTEIQIGIGYQVGKIYRKYCWDIISIMMAIMSTAIVIYFGEWIKSVIPINLIVLLLLVHVVYIGIRCYVKDWWEERGYY